MLLVSLLLTAIPSSAADDVDVLRPVHFASGEAMLDTHNLNDLQWNAHVLREHPEVELTLIGHADAPGSVAFNHDLAWRRAKQVKAQLVDWGVDPGRIDIISAGETYREVNVTAPSLANRRVEFLAVGADALVDGSVDEDEVAGLL